MQPKNSSQEVPLAEKSWKELSGEERRLRMKGRRERGEPVLTPEDDKALREENAEWVRQTTENFRRQREGK